jgi:hypothetical protein
MHFAVEVASVGEVTAMRDRLRAAGVQTTDVVDHEFIKSIYVFDPNGLRLEVTARTEAPGYVEEAARTAHGEMARWAERKAGLLAGRG